MQSPATTGTVQRPDLGLALAEFNTDRQIAKLVGHRILVPQPVLEESGNIGLWKMGQLSQQDTNIDRAEGAAYKEGNFKITQYSYETKDYGFAFALDDRAKARLRYVHGGDQMAFDLAAAQLARLIVLFAAEQRIMAATDLGSAAVATFAEHAVTTDWTDHANATPSEDIRAAIEKVIINCGEKPTSLALSGFAFRHLKQCESLLKELRGASLIASDKTAVTPDIIARFFDLEEVIVSDAQVNTAAPDATPVFEYAMNKDRALLFVRSGPLSPGLPMGNAGIGRVIHWTGDGSQMMGTVEEWVDPKIRGKYIRVRHDVDELIEVEEMGIVLTGVTS